MNKYLSVLSLLIVVVLSGRAQSSVILLLISDYSNMPSVGPKPTEASSFMKTILYPVNYAPDLPQIEILIYKTIKFTYHASGFKPNAIKQRISIGLDLQYNYKQQL